MKKQAGVWVVIGFLVLAAGLVYALSVSSPPGRQAAVGNQPTGSVATAEETESVMGTEVALGPDVTKVNNPASFLDPIPEGRKAPSFSVTTVDGKTISLQGYQGKKNLVLVFYQGSFCSVCGAQLSNLQKHLADFKAQDAEILAISADDKKGAMRSVGEHGLSFNVIPDPDKTLIKKFGVANVTKGGIAWPSLYIIDKQGVVRMSHADPKGHRLHSNEILPELSKITGKPAPKLGYDE